MSIIQMQEAAIQEMMEPRSSARRESKHRAAVARHYRSKSMSMGYSEVEARQQWKDVYDVYLLRINAD